MSQHEEWPESEFVSGYWESDTSTLQFGPASAQILSALSCLRVGAPISWSEILHADSRQGSLAKLKQASLDRSAFGFEAQIQTAVGSTKWVRVIGDCPSPNLLRGFLMEFSGSDSTDQGQQGERAALVSELEDAEARHRELFEGIPFPVICYDWISRRIIDVNVRAVTAYGYSRDEFLGLKLMDLWPEELAVLVDEAAEKLDLTSSSTSQSVQRRKDGTVIDVEISAHSVQIRGKTVRVLISRDITERIQRESELTAAYDATIEGWARALELRDHETEGHTRRVTEMTVELARLMNVPPQEIAHMRRGALLHDIGKMAIPDSVLLKPGELDEAEWIVMREHPGIALDLLAPVGFLKPALDIPFCHHERWDGSGYPRGLKGEEIPLSARIFAVIDVWDALRSHRPYRTGWSAEQAVHYIRVQSGRQFDPQVVDAFINNRDAIDRGRR